MNLMKRAAQIRRASGNRIAMPNAVKKAAAELRAKKRKKPAKKRKVGSTLLINKGESARKKPTRVYQVNRTKSGRYKGTKRVAGVGRVNSVSKATSVAKRLLVDDIAVLEARKFTARLKRDKNKIQKKISEKKALYRKLS